MTETITDKHLVEQVLGGKVEAFNLLVWRWQRPLYNFLLRLTGDAELARDLSQDAFLRSYQSLKDLKDREKFRSWLFRIAVNLHRSHVRRPMLQVEDSAEIDSLVGNPAQDRPGREEMQLTLRSLVSRLAPEHREVVFLRVFDGFQFDEMAVILDCPVSTVKSRLYKAFEQLRAGLDHQSPSSSSSSSS